MKAYKEIHKHKLYKYHLMLQWMSEERKYTLAVGINN